MMNSISGVILISGQLFKFEKDYKMKKRCHIQFIVINFLSFFSQLTSNFRSFEVNLVRKAQSAIRTLKRIC